MGDTHCGGGGGGGHPLLSQSSLLYAACDNSLLYAACDNIYVCTALFPLLNLYLLMFNGSIVKYSL